MGYFKNQITTLVTLVDINRGVHIVRTGYSRALTLYKTWVKLICHTYYTKEPFLLHTYIPTHLLNSVDLFVVCLASPINFISYCFPWYEREVVTSPLVFSGSQTIHWFFDLAMCWGKLQKMSHNIDFAPFTKETIKYVTVVHIDDVACLHVNIACLILLPYPSRASFWSNIGHVIFGASVSLPLMCQSTTFVSAFTKIQHIVLPMFKKIQR